MQAKLVYDAIAESGGFYSSPVDPAARSCMNVPFTIPSNSDLEAEFVKEAGAAGLVCMLPSPAPCPLLPVFVKPREVAPFQGAAFQLKQSASGARARGQPRRLLCWHLHGPTYIPHSFS